MADELVFSIYERLDGADGIAPVFDREFTFGWHKKDINDFKCVGVFKASGSFVQYLNSGAIALLARGEDGGQYELFAHHVMDSDFPEIVLVAKLWRPPHERDSHRANW